MLFLGVPYCNYSKKGAQNPSTIVKASFFLLFSGPEADLPTEAGIPGAAHRQALAGGGRGAGEPRGEEFLFI